jgi:glycosyltransferase involved in cell wall biosynthesis
MHPSPTVTIVTPTKNRRALLCETMDSVQRQSFQAWEHVIVDDGSDDGTAEEVRRRAGSDPRVRYIQRTGSRAGANICRNQGLSAAAADLIVFLDSDDLLRAGCLETRVAIMGRNADLDFAVFRAGVFIRSVGDFPRLYHEQTQGDDLLRFLALECLWQTAGPIWRRDFLHKIEGFDENLLSMQDLDMHVRAICAGGKYLFIRAIDHDIRGHDDAARTSTRHFTDPVYIEAAERLVDKLFNTVQSAGLLTWSRQRAVLGLGFGLTECWVKVGRAERAMNTWNKACDRHGGPLHVRLFGLGILQLQRLVRTDSSVVSRLVNKWKGWFRFRPEPNLMPVGNTAEANAPHLARFES